MPISSEQNPGQQGSMELEYAWLDRMLDWLVAERSRLIGDLLPQGEPSSDHPEIGFRFDVLAQVTNIACKNATIEDLWTDSERSLQVRFITDGFAHVLRGRDVRDSLWETCVTLPRSGRIEAG